MNYIQFFVSKTNCFSNCNKSFEDASFIIIGAPFDCSSSYRPGSRFAPSAIREASKSLETYSFRLKIESDLNVHDLGDLDVLASIDGNIERIGLVLNEILAFKKNPVIIGGEHTLTYSCAKTFNEVGILCFDAHMDLRDEYLGMKFSHATFMRRICEAIGPEKVMLIGTRSASREELEYASEKGVEYITSLYIQTHSKKNIVKKITAFLSKFNNFYLSIDMDVLDPAFAPAVSNPVPEGLSPTTILDLIYLSYKKGIKGLDLTEVTPQYDSGQTSLEAAYLIFNTLSLFNMHT